MTTNSVVNAEKRLTFKDFIPHPAKTSLYPQVMVNVMTAFLIAAWVAVGVVVLLTPTGPSTYAYFIAGPVFLGGQIVKALNPLSFNQVAYLSCVVPSKMIGMILPMTFFYSWIFAGGNSGDYSVNRDLITFFIAGALALTTFSWMVVKGHNTYLNRYPWRIT